MPMAKTQIITGNDGKPAYAIVPWKVWQRVRPFAGGVSDEALYDAAKARKSEVFPAEVANAILDGVNPIKALREHRGLTQAALAKAAGIGRLYLSQIETGRRAGSLATLRALAKALKVNIDLIAPMD